MNEIHVATWYTTPCKMCSNMRGLRRQRVFHYIHYLSRQSHHFALPCTYHTAAAEPPPSPCPTWAMICNNFLCCSISARTRLPSIRFRRSSRCDTCFARFVCAISTFFSTVVSRASFCSTSLYLRERGETGKKERKKGRKRGGGKGETC